MRLVTLRTYRAFPELDAYSDEQCRRFVRAAQRSWVRRFVHLGLAWLVGLAVLVSACAVFVLVGLDEVAFGSRGSGRAVFAAFSAVVLLSTGPIAALIVRDRLMRRRIRYVLRARGRCANCRYGLIGLPVDAGSTVTCPECGMASSVDPSLGELVIDEAGRARYQPPAQAASWLARRLTPRRKRLMRRTALAVVALVVLGLPAGWGGYELFLRWQARVAQRERPGVQAIIAWVEASQPAGVPKNAPNAADALASATRALSKAESRLYANGYPTAPRGGTIRPQLSTVCSLPPARAEGDEIVEFEMGRIEALRLLRACRDGGVFEELQALAESPRAVEPIVVGLNQPMVTALIPTLGDARQLARLCGDRMDMATLAGDRAEFVEALEHALALARLKHHEPFLISSLVGIAIEALAYNRVRTLLARHPPAEWLDAMDAAIARQPVPRTMEFVLEGERLAAMDTTAWLFSDPDHVRWGRFSSTVRRMAGGTFMSIPEYRLGTYRENVNAINEMWADFQAHAKLERFQRPRAVDDEPSLAMVAMLTPAVGSARRANDQIELDRRGYRVMAALERHRHAHGEYPAALADLAPALLSEVPIDPWSGKPLCYVRIDPATDRHGREYLLYSVGFDGQDNGGKPSIHRWDALTGRSAVAADKTRGTDFIINEPEVLVPPPTLSSEASQAPAAAPVETGAGAAP